LPAQPLQSRAHLRFDGLARVEVTHDRVDLGGRVPETLECLADGADPGSSHHFGFSSCEFGSRKFFDSLKVSREIGDYFFVHAGVRPGVPLDRQHESDCMFIRGDFLNHSGDFGKIIVHGHTPVEEPQVLPNRIALDTGAFFSGRLTALCLEGTTRSFLIADARDQRG
jgi:diadenosine tetraphosphatase ApaH/serine/threonine PP2A family protein phosphatase